MTSLELRKKKVQHKMEMMKLLNDINSKITKYKSLIDNNEGIKEAYNSLTNSIQYLIDNSLNAKDKEDTKEDEAPHEIYY